MNQFTFLQDSSRELELFPHIIRFTLTKINAVFLDSFLETPSNHLRIYYVVDGKFQWSIDHKSYVLYPGDCAIILPGQEFGGKEGFLDRGTLFCLFLKTLKRNSKKGIHFGNWSKLSAFDRFPISNLIVNNKLPVLRVDNMPDTLHEVHKEILNHEVGFQTRVNHLLDTLLINIARQTNRQNEMQEPTLPTLMNLEEILRQNLAHHWTVDEMASRFGLHNTSFTEKVKYHTGFPPLNYLINLRIAEAINLLKQPGLHFTDIALMTGFYSSQHFSTTFKKLTGYSPTQFRKRNLPHAV
ncbi:MAG: AraC family transcriptional regulator [Cyclobacteriaceae bacterium]